ncbi:uncharacterized protein, partial [Palaemon carinicauda]|uniref:uncharacterized protein n=1 Tax=Palaemon carinicauda TaxID=392227 RepID=UPI0035B5B5B4
MDAEGRSFSEKYYHAVSKSAVKIERLWLCYSVVLNKAYCETYWLFANRGASRFQDTWIDGYCDWKHIGKGMKMHESFQIHYNSCLVYGQWCLHGTLSEALEGNLQKEKKYWCQVLDRLLNVTLSLAMGNLPFRGHKEGTQAEDEGDYVQNHTVNIFCIKILQSKAVDLAKAADLLKVCMDVMCRLRNQFEDVKKEATDIAQKWSIRPEFEKKRLHTVKRQFGELCEDQRLEDPESFCMLVMATKGMYCHDK